MNNVYISNIRNVQNKHPWSHFDDIQGDDLPEYPFRTEKLSTSNYLGIFRNIAEPIDDDFLDAMRKMIDCEKIIVNKDLTNDGANSWIYRRKAFGDIIVVQYKISQVCTNLLDILEEFYNEFDDGANAIFLKCIMSEKIRDPRTFDEITKYYAMYDAKTL